MKVIDEMKTSLFKPHMYYTMQYMSFNKLMRFSFIATITGVMSSVLYTLFGALLMGRLGEVAREYLKYTVPLALSTIFYMWIGILISALALSLIFLVISKFSKYEKMNFYKLYNYAIHTLFPCIVLTPLFGPLVILLSIGFFLMAVKGEVMGAKVGFDPIKLLKK
jgi:hypothetical protein